MKALLVKVNGLLLLFCLLLPSLAPAQDPGRSLSLQEYQKAKRFEVNDLDKDTYLKVDNTYLLDKGKMPPPYFITGDDGLRKRIDLYQLIDKPSKKELGILIYYTNEKATLYTALLPSASAEAAVWNQYFEDIHATNKEEADYVLKLAYVLSKELSRSHARGGAPNAQLEGATYGTEICFPGNQQVLLANGSYKKLAQLQPGEQILALNPQTGTVQPVAVTHLAVHSAQPYALTRLQLVHEQKVLKTGQGVAVRLKTRQLLATPNHPVATKKGTVQAGSLPIGTALWVVEEGEKPALYTLQLVEEVAGPSQKVYSLEVQGQSLQPIVNDVVVLQKE